MPGGRQGVSSLDLPADRGGVTTTTRGVASLSAMGEARRDPRAPRLEPGVALVGVEKK